MVNAPGLPCRSACVTAILTGVGSWSNQDAGVLVICKLIAAATFAPVASQHVHAHRAGAAAMKASGAFIYIHTTPSISLVPRGTLTGVVHTCSRMATGRCVAHVAPVIARIHQSSV